MAEVSTDRYHELVFDWIPIVFRLAIIWVFLDAEPYVTWKFLNPPAVIDFLASIGTPMPGTIVYVIGVIEIATVITVILGFYAGIPAAFAVVEFIFAIGIGGPNRRNVMFLAGAFVILAMGTGRLSIRNYLVIPDVYNRYVANR